ncbi:AN13D protein, partial [Podargus strigoides]|nr:AN13D protein [Podargus strigoides]
RNKSGIWGWRSEKMEVVSGYEAKVYSASNVELVTKTRTEHLSDQDKSRSKGSRTPFHSFLGIAQQHGTHNGAPVLQAASPTNPTAITPEEYFDPHFDLETRNIGRPIEMSSKVQRRCHRVTWGAVGCHGVPWDAVGCRGMLWGAMGCPGGAVGCCGVPWGAMGCRGVPWDAMGCHGVPWGAFRVLWETHGAPGWGGTGWPFPCEVEAGVFEVPAGYTVLGAGRSEPLRDEDDDLLQFAIQQSLLDAGTETDQVTIWEALTNTRPGVDPPPYDEDLQLERAHHPATGSPPGAGGGSPPGPPGPPSSNSFAEQLRLAMALSEREQEEQERRRREEDEELQRILRLSLTDK